MYHEHQVEPETDQLRAFGSHWAQSQQTMTRLSRKFSAPTPHRLPRGDQWEKLGKYLLFQNVQEVDDQQCILHVNEHPGEPLGKAKDPPTRTSVERDMRPTLAYMRDRDPAQGVHILRPWRLIERVEAEDPCEEFRRQSRYRRTGIVAR